jgi:hypothetical protein
MAASQSLTRNIDRLTAFTNETILPGVRHLQFQNDPAAWIFLGDAIDPKYPSGMPMQGAGKRSFAGSSTIQVSHAVESNNSAKRMTGPWDTFDTTPQDFVRRSEANLKHYSATMTFSLTDELVNVGSQVVADQMTEEARNRMGSLLLLCVQDVYSGNVSTAATGLDSIISANDSVQGLSGATYSVWNSRGLSARGTAPGSVSFTGGSFATRGISDFITAYNNATEGMMAPNVILTTWDIHAFYENKLVQFERYNAPTVGTTGNVTFGGLAFRKASVFASPNATSGVAYFLNTDVCYADFLSGADFRAMPFIQASQQEAKTSELVAKFQMIVEDRRLLNKITGVVA